MNCNISNNSEQALTALIQGFWQWFSLSSAELKRLYTCRSFQELSNTVAAELDKINAQLAWEIGAGRGAPFLLTISVEGEPELGKIAERMVAMAPELVDWDVHSPRPQGEAPGKICLPGQALKPDAQSVTFNVVEG